uniref:Uncharacterized protein n=1 Tax=Solanum tuberosum TaxID=4113 RepID=M1DST0_SOLTU
MDREGHRGSSLGLGSGGSGLGTLPLPVIETTTHGGLRGLMPEIWRFCLPPHEHSHGSCGGARPVKGHVVHHSWEGVTQGEDNGQWFLTLSVHPFVVRRFSAVLPVLRYKVL